MKEALLKIYVCTKDLKTEKEIAHYKEPEGITKISTEWQNRSRK